MVIGASNCGKSALVQALEGRGAPPRRAAMPIYGARTILCPGAYIENVHMYRHLIALAQDASCVLAVIRAEGGSYYSPGFVRALGRPSAGVIITTAERIPADSSPPAPGLTLTENAQADEAPCKDALRQAGIQGPIFSVDPQKRTGLRELEAYLLQFEAGGAPCASRSPRPAGAEKPGPVHGRKGG